MARGGGIAHGARRRAQPPARSAAGRRLGAWLAASAVALAAPARALGLLDAYQLALAHDPTLQSAQAAREAGQENIALGRAGLLPQLGLSYQRAPRNSQDILYRAGARELTVERDFASYSAQLTLTQPLYDAAAWARWEQGQAQALMADERLREAQQALVVRLAKTYTDALYAQDQLALARAQHRAYAELLQLNQRAFEHGDGTRIEIAQTEARMRQAEVQAIDAQDGLDIALRALQDVTGADEGALGRLDGLRADFAAALAPGLATPGLAHWRALALAGNAELAAQRQSLAASEAAIRRERAGHLPTLRGYLQHTQNKSDVAATYDQRYRTDTVGLMLNVPLFSGGAVSAATRQAQREHDAARSALEARTDETLLELRRQWRASASGPARIAAAALAVRAAEVALDGARRGVAAGDRINLDVLDAAEQLFTARRDLARACYDTLNARLALRWRAGVLGADDLRETAGFFSSAAAGISGAGLAAPSSLLSTSP